MIIYETFDYQVYVQSEISKQQEDGEKGTNLITEFVLVTGDPKHSLVPLTALRRKGDPPPGATTHSLSLAIVFLSVITTQ